MKTKDMMKALVQNYKFRVVKESRLPTIDFVYPSFTADGNSEQFRLSYNLREQLSNRSGVVTNDLAGKTLLWTPSDEILIQVDKISPRLGIEDQLSGKINSVYYPPILFVRVRENDFTAYVVKPIVDESMAWFELTEQEKQNIHNLLKQKAQERPYQNLITKIAKLLGGRK